MYLTLLLMNNDTRMMQQRKALSSEKRTTGHRKYMYYYENRKCSIEKIQKNSLIQFFKRNYYVQNLCVVKY